MGRRNNVIVSIEFDVSAVCILSLSLSAHRFSDYLNKATTCMLWGDCMLVVVLKKQQKHFDEKKIGYVDNVVSYCWLFWKSICFEW